MTKPKRISRQGVLGQRGVNILEKVVLDMGSRWSPSGPNEVGIDGYIELFDPDTGEALGKTVGVQSKAVARFDQESENSFKFRCKPRDIDYWLKGNMPIILVVSCPDAEEAYWVSVKDYFTGKDSPQSATLAFDKVSTRFDKNAFDSLLTLGRSSKEGLYLAAAPRPEFLVSNLLPLENSPEDIWVGVTDLNFPGQV